MHVHDARRYDGSFFGRLKWNKAKVTAVDVYAGILDSKSLGPDWKRQADCYLLGSLYE